MMLRLDPERAHDTTISALEWLRRSRLGLPIARRRFGLDHAGRLEQRVFGKRFSNPVGLAAGFDKNARVVHGLAALGFGFVEVGTVTPRPQPGNPKPRIFRHRESESLQNALGFNNDGMRTVCNRLAARGPFPVPLGVNVGKNASTALEDAEADYEALFRRFAGRADYFVINISSPNTPGLRDLQTPDRVAGLLRLGRELGARPLMVKLSPDLEPGMAVELARAAVDAGAEGIVLTNTTTDYGLVAGARNQGGLSGRVLRDRSFRCLQEVAAELFGRAVLVSVGGIDSGDEVYRRLCAGASLVQVYTALVYRGPGLVRAMLSRLLELMDRDGLRTLEHVVGKDLKKAG